MSGAHSILKVLRPVRVPNVNNVTAASSVDEIVKIRSLHQEHRNVVRGKGKNEGFSTSLARRYTDEDSHGDPRERKRKTDETGKKIEMKDWSEQSPAWLNRDHNESDLVKHIEVLQRFADRYNSAYGTESQEKTKTELTDEGRKRLLKILDKQPSKKFSTFVRTQERKKREDRMHRKDRSGISKAFITLANEPRKTLVVTPKPKPIVPTVKNFQNPDSILLKSVLGQNQTPKLRLYSIVNPKFKNKEFEAYLKKTFLSSPNNEKIKEKKLPEATIGEYFTDRYTKKLDAVKAEVKSGPNLSSKLQDTLVQGRRSATVAKGIKPEPVIHPKTSLLVQKSHLPLTLCKNIREAGGKSEKTEVMTTDPKKTTIPAVKMEPEEAKKRARRNESIFNKLMKYFKR